MPVKEKKLAGKLREKINNLPSSPGVYLFRDEPGNIIYVGKAADLSNRVRGYFQPGRPREPKNSLLVQEIAGLDYYPTPTEAEAFFLESRFIKAYQPRYNIDLRDDKTFPCLRITREDFSRVEIVRGVRLRKDAWYFGPFTDAGALRKAVRKLREIFPVAACRRRIRPGALSRPCMEYDLKRCLAPCAGKVSRSEYQQVVAALLSFFHGKSRHLIRELQAAMREAAEELRFEDAARLRDEVAVLQRVKKHPRLSGPEIPTTRTVLNLKEALKLDKEPVLIEAYDISNLFGGEAVGSMVVFMGGEPHRKAYRRFRISETVGINDCAMLAEVLRRRISEKHWPLPDLVLVDGGRGQVETVARILAGEQAGEVPVRGLAKEEERLFAPGVSRPLPLDPSSPAGLFLRRARDEAHRVAVSYHRRVRQKQHTGSRLDGVPGIGPRRKEILWRHFRSLPEIKAAAPEELKALGIPGAVVARLKRLELPGEKRGN